MKTQLSYDEFKARSRFDKDELIAFAKGPWWRMRPRTSSRGFRLRRC